MTGWQSDKARDFSIGHANHPLTLTPTHPLTQQPTKRGEPLPMTQPFRGVFTIPFTPIHENQSVDWQGLRRVVDFCVECGAHGIVWPVNASQFATLTDDERLKGMQIVTEQVAGRIPVVLGTQGVSAVHAAFLSRHAQAVGADAVMAMAPYVQPLGNDDAIMHYYRAIDAEVDMPIFVQNHTRGSVLPVKTLARLVDEVEHVEYIKEETFPVTHMVTQVQEACGPKLKGVFGGAGGRYLLLEHPRGVAGQMPGCHLTDVVVGLWNALEAGDREEAKRIFNAAGADLCAGDGQRIDLRRGTAPARRDRVLRRSRRRRAST